MSFFVLEHAQKLQVKSRTSTRSRPQILSSLTLIQHGTCFKVTPACWDLPQRQHQVKRWAVLLIFLPKKTLNCCDKRKHNVIFELRAENILWKSEEDQGLMWGFLMGVDDTNRPSNYTFICWFLSCPSRLSKNMVNWEGQWLVGFTRFLRPTYFRLFFHVYGGLF